MGFVMGHILQGLGFTGSVIFLSAYVPQIVHLVRVKNSAGISILSWTTWLIGGLCLLIYSLSVRDAVFIFMSVLEALALATVLALAVMYQTKK